ncbi:hypothetical protein KCP69_25805 [Salmonella enterica subsp. enterica]|nr:hypothetical protein KCP69_25805 [Salmonella enterica subsp. enterica]
MWGFPGGWPVLLASLMCMGAAAWATSGHRRRAKRPRCVTAYYRQPFTRRETRMPGPLSLLAEVNANIRAYYRVVRCHHNALSIWVMQLIAYHKELICLIYPPRSLPCYRVRAPVCSTARDSLPRMQAYHVVGADISRRYRTGPCVTPASWRARPGLYIDQHHRR